MSTVRTLVAADRLVRHYRVQKDALRFGRFGLGWFRREFETVKAIDEISFSIDRASSVGLIGLNGAGKSTLVKLITGVLAPTDGGITVNGLEPHRNRTEVTRHIDVVFGHRTQMWWELPLMETYRVLRRIYGIPRGEFDDRVEKLATLLEVKEMLSRAPRQLSLGQRMRAEIMASLLHGPKLLLLDEPTVGIDFVAKSRIRALIRSLVSQENVTVILASHELTDIHEICDDAMLLHRGKIVFHGPLKSLMSQTEGYTTLDIDLEPDGAPGGRPQRVSVSVLEEQINEKIAEVSQQGRIVNISTRSQSLEAVLTKFFPEQD